MSAPAQQQPKWLRGTCWSIHNHVPMFWLDHKFHKIKIIRYSCAGFLLRTERPLTSYLSPQWALASEKLSPLRRMEKSVCETQKPTPTHPSLGGMWFVTSVRCSKINAFIHAQLCLFIVVLGPMPLVSSQLENDASVRTILLSALLSTFQVLYVFHPCPLEKVKGLVVSVALMSCCVC